LTVDFPLLVLGLSFAALALSVKVGDFIRKRSGASQEKPRDDLGVVLAATLTLLGLIIGFSFSMATSRYELRKSCEQIEANAIATEWIRSDLLPGADAPKLRELLKTYLDKRLLFYTVRNRQQLRSISFETTQLQNDLWSAIRSGFPSAPPPVQGILISGLNDVINSEASTQAAFDNRVPLLAWLLIVVIASGCSFLIGLRAHRTDWLVFLVIPIAISISLFLIADLDSPREGAIRNGPKNLIRLTDAIDTASITHRK
jgi:hypothetical protein